MIEFLTAELWVPRWCCGYFPWWLVAVYALANFKIFVSYMLIPMELGRAQKSGAVLFETPKQTNNFVRFIRACGIGHLLDGVLVFIWPHYPLFALWHCLTAYHSNRARRDLSKLTARMVSRESAAESVSEIRDVVSSQAWESIESLSQAIHTTAEQQLRKYQD